MKAKYILEADMKDDMLAFGVVYYIGNEPAIARATRLEPIGYVVSEEEEEEQA